MLADPYRGARVSLLQWLCAIVMVALVYFYLFSKFLNWVLS